MQKVSLKFFFTFASLSCSILIANGSLANPSLPTGLNRVSASDSVFLAQRRDWEITKEGTDRTCTHGKFGVFSRHKTTKLWWSKDTAGHGNPPPVWKVFDETPRSLDWKADADRYGDFIVGKHKGPTGTSIPFSEMSCRS
jgi:hypothetical protein